MTRESFQRARNVREVAKRRSLRIFDAIPPYLGGKRAMLADIFREISRHIDTSRWKDTTFIDGFVGGGSVSIYAKAHFKSVVGNDLSEHTATIARAVLTNNDMLLNRSHAVMLLAGNETADGYVSQTKKEWFTPETARIIDNALAYADSMHDTTTRALLRLVVWRIVLNSRPSSGDFTSRNLVERAMSGELKASGTAGAKFAYHPPTIDDVQNYMEATNRGVFRGNYTFTQDDSLKRCVDWGADVVYLDPPYAGDTAYEKYYHIADCCMAGEELAKNEISPFSDKKTACDAIETLIAGVKNAGTRLMLINNSDEAISRQTLLAMVQAHFPQAYEVQLEHKHSNAAGHGNDSAKSGATEVLIVGYRA
jgi:DNA adenine methylase